MNDLVAKLGSEFKKYEPMKEGDETDGYLVLAKTADDDHQGFTLTHAHYANGKQISSMLYLSGGESPAVKHAIYEAAKKLKRHDKHRKSKGENPDLPIEPCPHCGVVHPPGGEGREGAIQGLTALLNRLNRRNAQRSQADGPDATRSRNPARDTIITIHDESAG